jgi:glycosyltransferase involved in cell wall biosynthesis
MDKPLVELYERTYSTIVDDDCPTVQHQVPDCFFKNRKTKLSIGYTIFEMVRVPSTWVPFCNDMDVIWTGSEYSRDAFVNSGVKVPVKILPHAIDVELYSPSAAPWRIKNRRGFAFLSIMDFTDRKAWKETLRAFWKAFGPKDDVCLVLKAYYGGFSNDAKRDVLRRIAKFKAESGIGETAPVLVYTHEINDSDMPGLYRSADCYVSLAREGFGLTGCEAMACGLPCIGPEVGGSREYMTADNSLLVRYEGDEPISNQVVQAFPSFAGLSWAKHSWEDLAEKMKLVVSDHALRKDVAEKGLKHVKERHNFRAIGEKIASLLPG